MNRDLNETIEEIVEGIMEKFHISRPDATECLTMALADPRITELITETAAVYLDSFK